MELVHGPRLFPLKREREVNIIVLNSEGIADNYLEAKNNLEKLNTSI
jgi:hypothetical protein